MLENQQIDIFERIRRRFRICTKYILQKQQYLNFFSKTLTGARHMRIIATIIIIIKKFSSFLTSTLELLFSYLLLPIRVGMNYE